MQLRNRNVDTKPIDNIQITTRVMNLRNRQISYDNFEAPVYQGIYDKSMKFIDYRYERASKRLQELKQMGYE